MEQFKTWEEMTDLEKAASTWWDLYKDVHGVRPRGVDTSNWTLAGFEAQIQALSIQLQMNEEEESKAQAEAIATFERRIADWHAFDGADRATAIQRLHHAFETFGDDAYLEYRLNLPYGYIRKEAA